MATILRVFIIAMLFYLVVWVVRGLIRPAGKATPAAAENELVRDSQTGVYFERSKALVVIREGQTHFFANAETRDAWLRRNSN
ncbi:MAG: hypothetical protein LBR80_16550 [Deltaproteobacteria bacterium]|jgi:hypothetical protein|nr:hypothetical protein [Deltaproteobacteria bacterium]